MSDQVIAKSTNVPSSPPSAGSHTRYASPSTNPTVMSPDGQDEGKDVDRAVPVFELSTPSSAFRQTGNSTAATLSSRRNLTVPPVTIPKGSILSPTAEDFTPSTAATFKGTASCKPNEVRPGVIGKLNSVKPALSKATALDSICQQLVASRFTVEEETTRAFIVTGVNPQSTNYQYIAHAFQNFNSLVTINALGLSNGYFSVEFADFHDAKQACCLALAFLFPGQNVQVYKLFPKDIITTKGGSAHDISQHEAEYIVNVVDLGGQRGPIGIEHIIRACVAHGDLKAVRPIKARQGCIMSIRVEYCDKRAPVGLLNGTPLCGYRLAVERHTPDIDPKYISRLPAIPTGVDDSDRKYTASMMDYLRRSADRQPSSGTQNVVDINRILLGKDVRTTIMLRNIPNRVDQATLKHMLDQTSLGAYDFMYLRIDFANNCNVGYAFINFVDPISIVPFARARAGRRWNLFNSDKIAEISYATIQGRDCLIQKFRNSSVMLERPEYRPKLFFTGDGSDAGDEEPFPRPDNQAKLRRSCDNAEHVGLYYPPTSSNPTTPTMTPELVAPSRQLPGGVYTVPARSRRAIAINQMLAAEVQSPSLYAGSSQSSSSPDSISLYAPREGQAYRERQARQFSQFDRGTTIAENAMTQVPGFTPRSLPTSFPDSSLSVFSTPLSTASTGRHSNRPMLGSPMPLRPSSLNSSILDSANPLPSFGRMYLA